MTGEWVEREKRMAGLERAGRGERKRGAAMGLGGYKLEVWGWVCVGGLMTSSLTCQMYPIIPHCIIPTADHDFLDAVFVQQIHLRSQNNPRADLISAFTDLSQKQNETGDIILIAVLAVLCSVLLVTKIDKKRFP